MLIEHSVVNSISVLDSDVGVEDFGDKTAKLITSISKLSTTIFHQYILSSVVKFPATVMSMTTLW